MFGAAKLEHLAEKTGERLGAIDVSLAKAETRLESMATKADVSDAKNSIIVWVVGAIFFTQLLPMIPTILKAFKLMS